MQIKAVIVEYVQIIEKKGLSLLANCPNCDYRLKPWNIKAECPSCKQNIPNFNWEQRLEEDAIRSEKAFTLLKERFSNARRFLFGSPLLKIRFILTFLPLIMLVLPFMSAKVNLPFISEDESFSVLSIILDITNGKLDMSSAIELIGGEVIGKPILFLAIGVLLLVVAFIIAVLSFFLLLIRSVSLDGRGNVLCNALSFLSSLICIGIFLYAFYLVGTSGVDFILFPTVGIALIIQPIIYALNLILNVLCSKTLHKERIDFKTKRKAIGKLR